MMLRRLLLRDGDVHGFLTLEGPAGRCCSGLRRMRKGQAVVGSERDRARFSKVGGLGSSRATRGMWMTASPLPAGVHGAESGSRAGLTVYGSGPWVVGWGRGWVYGAVGG